MPLWRKSPATIDVRHLADRQDDRAAERSVAQAEQDHDVVRAGTGDGQVEVAVAVEVGRDQPRGVDAHGDRLAGE